MIDWHSHILPQMDDGSRDVAESLSLLKMLSSQGVKTAIATPHFYANDESAERFLERRQNSFSALKEQLFEDAPNILLGAEVKYYQGISKMQGLKSLCIEGTGLLLLEMPVSRWTEYTIRELIELSSRGDIRIVLAHIERYYSLQKASVWDRLYDSGILMQVNASFFIGITRRKALAMLKNNEIHFIGSDCHNVQSRPPQLDRAYEAITKRFGEGITFHINELGNSMLG